MNSQSQAKVTVVVPFFSGEEFVEQCIESIITQSHRNLEVILVDDGSPDQSGVICDKFARLDRRVRVIHQENRGLVNARKSGVRAASGTYLSFVDGDDWIGPRHIEAHLDLMTSESADLTICGHVREFLGTLERVRPRIRPGTYESNEINEDILPRLIFNGTFFQHGVSTYVWNKMFRLEQGARLLGGIPDAVVMGEDAALTYPYLIACSRIAVSHDGEYFYRQRPNSILKSVDSMDLEYGRLSTLFQYLRRCLAGAPQSACLMDQLRMYFYALVLTRSGGIIRCPNDKMWFTPFQGLRSGMNVVVCSSGSFGQRLVEGLRGMGSIRLVGWIDEDYKESQLLGLQVTPLHSITHMEFDLVLIASIDPDYTESVTEKLTAIGVLGQVISHVKPDFSELENFLANIGFNLSNFEYLPNDYCRWTSL